MTRSIRQLLREDLLARMVGLSSHHMTGPRDTLAKPLDADSVPSAAVWISTEDVPERRKGGSGLRVIERQPEIEIHLAANAGSDRALVVLEEMAAAVEHRMLGRFRDLEFTYEGVVFGENREGDPILVTAVLSYSLTYKTEEGDPAGLA